MKLVIVFISLLVFFSNSKTVFSYFNEPTLCSNFTGSWHGQCKSSNVQILPDGPRDTVFLQSTCKEITWDNEVFIMGQEKHIQKTDDNGIEINGYSIVDWDSEKIQMSMNEHGTVKHPSMPNEVAYKGYSIVKFDGEKLMLESVIVSFGDQILNLKQTCSLEKKR